MAYEYSIDDPARNQKRTLAFVIVVIIHVLFFWVLASGLGAKIVEVVIAPVQTKIIEDTPDEDKPPPPPPEMEQPPPYVPPPDFAIDTPAPSGPTTAITNTTTERPTVAPVAPAPAPVQKASVKTPPSVTGKGARASQPEYPPSSRRAGEAGTVTLAAYVPSETSATELSPGEGETVCATPFATTITRTGMVVVLETVMAGAHAAKSRTMPHNKMTASRRVMMFAPSYCARHKLDVSTSKSVPKVGGLSGRLTTIMSGRVTN